MENNKSISRRLEDSLKLRHIDASIKSKNIKGNFKIKPYDIYIIDTMNYNQIDKYTIVKKILSHNDQANIFLLNDSAEEKENINMELGSFAHIFKGGEAVNEILTCDEKGLEKIIETIETVENTKKKLHDLWNKLEKTT